MFDNSGLAPGDIIKIGELEAALIMIWAGGNACLIPASSPWLAHPDVICGRS
ncbi:hypothetical protein [Sphingobium sp. PAMC28499]|uniref:hypothetical protein n=1 Tax=Sphingobium sp. PAMC28499 TaxID=2565554 RepID=UPI0014467620|nr:hypothetical protein [Sphingobium sp. PAMC28499]